MMIHNSSIHVLQLRKGGIPQHVLSRSNYRYKLKKSLLIQNKNVRSDDKNLLNFRRQANLTTVHNEQDMYLFRQLVFLTMAFKPVELPDLIFHRTLCSCCDGKAEVGVQRLVIQPVGDTLLIEEDSAEGRRRWDVLQITYIVCIMKKSAALSSLYCTGFV